MRHRVKKIKFKKGKDATKMVLRKLAVNFIKKGKIRTTLKKAKVLKSIIDKIVSQAKKNKKEWLTKHLVDKKIVTILIEKVAPVFATRKSGFVKIKKLIPRLSDGSQLAELTWVEPVIISETKKAKEKNAKTNPDNKTKK